MTKSKFQCEIDLKQPLKQLISDIGRKKYLPDDDAVLAEIYSLEKKPALINIMQQMIESFLSEFKGNDCSFELVDLNCDNQEILAQVSHSNEFKNFLDKIRQELILAAEQLLEECDNRNVDEKVASGSSSSTSSASVISDESSQTVLQADADNVSISIEETESIDRLSLAEPANSMPWSQHQQSHTGKPEAHRDARSFVMELRRARMTRPTSTNSITTERITSASSAGTQNFSEAENSRERQLHELDSSFSETITQDDCMFLSQNQLAELAHSLNPRQWDVKQRLTALRQIVNLPILDVQTCESWMLPTASSLTPTRKATPESEENSAVKTEINPTDDDKICALSTSRLTALGPVYSIRMGILDALNDNDDEIWSLALKFVAKGFATTSSNIKECYCLLVEYLNEQFSTNDGCMPLLAHGLDLSQPRMNRIFRAMWLFHEVNKQIAQVWIRYPEKLVTVIMEQCINILSIGCSNPDPHFMLSSPVSPAHIMGLLDHQANWITKWMRGAYSFRPLLRELRQNVSFINACAVSCCRFFLQCPQTGAFVAEKHASPLTFSPTHLDAANFLHSLHLITSILCVKEGLKLFPIQFAASQLAVLADHNLQETGIAASGRLTVGDFLCLMLKFLAQITALEVKSSVNTVWKRISDCLARLSTSPTAFEVFFILSNRKSLPPSKKRKQRLQTNKSGRVVASENMCNGESVLDVLLEPIVTLHQRLLAGTRLHDLDQHLYDTSCHFASIIANLLSNPNCRSALRRSGYQTIVLGTVRGCLCDLLQRARQVTIPDAVQLKRNSPSVEIPASLISSLAQILCLTCLTSEWMTSSAKFSLHLEIIETWKSITGKGRESMDLNATVGSYFTNMQKSLQECLLCLAGTPKGLELLRKHDLLRDCVECIFVRYARVTKMQKYERFGHGLLVSQLAASAIGYRCLQVGGFSELCLENAWSILQCLHPSFAQPNTFQTLESAEDHMPGSSNDIAQQLWEGGQCIPNTTGGRSSSRAQPLPPPWPIDPIDKPAQKPFSHLANLFSSFFAVREAVLSSPFNSPIVSSSDLFPPTSLTELINRLVDPSLSAALCRPEESFIFGLRLLSVLVSSLDTLLLLDAGEGFHLVDLLLKEQASSAVADIQDTYIIDAGLVERNYLLVKCSLIGGPSERCLPARTLCEHREEFYPFPIVTKLPCNASAYSNPAVFCKLKCLREPCVSTAELELCRLGQAPVKEAPGKSSSFFTMLVGAVVSAGKSSKGSTAELPLFNRSVSSLLRTVPSLGKGSKPLDIGAIFEACLKRLLLLDVNKKANELTFALDDSASLTAFEEAGIRLTIRYGRRVQALDPLATPSQQAARANELLNSVKCLLGVGRSPPASTCASVAASSAGERCLSPDVDEAAKHNISQFYGFDWFSATIFLIFEGSSSRAFSFLSQLYKTRVSNYLWPIRSQCLAVSPVDEGQSQRGAEISPVYYKICHHFEIILAKELPGVMNTFRMSGHPPSKVLFHWVSQCFWNYLDWQEIVDFILLCLLNGPEFMAYTGVAILRHLKPILLQALQTQTHLVILKEEPIHGFRFTEHLAFMEKLAAKYGSEVVCDLKVPTQVV